MGLSLQALMDNKRTTGMPRSLTKQVVYHPHFQKRSHVFSHNRFIKERGWRTDNGCVGSYGKEL
jgi:hypothetical protein